MEVKRRLIFGGFTLGRRRESSDLVEKSKSVRHTPMFDEFAVHKSTDIDNVNGHRFA
jgi:hypothetical protein